MGPRSGCAAWPLEHCHYGSGRALVVLRTHDHSYDNASCESFFKTLKREEIYATEYADLNDLHEAPPLPQTPSLLEESTR
jgi:transposase InsO family protein